MKYGYLFCILLALSISCKKSTTSNPHSNESIAYVGDNLMPYGQPWTEGEIYPESFKRKGECSIVGDKIFFKKIDLDFSGIDYCVNDNQDPENLVSCAVVEYFEIDFSKEEPKIQSTKMNGCD